ncbi:uncharacterized protein LOC116654574 [Drosophila ananassae]|uniref:uncharacterized protein LOC116654574 n=1 Tax=Drosophila ananassae TaxID=7217 RepID=UPI0013A5C1AE|nr:uncharacterized protein LOC116654574 [Drosophila ananassae]
MQAFEDASKKICYRLTVKWKNCRSNAKLFQRRRKCSRIDNICDVFHRAMDTSDPIISSVNLDRRIHNPKKMKLPPEVLDMLLCEGGPSEDFEYEEEFDDSLKYELNFELENENQELLQHLDP